MQAKRQVQLEIRVKLQAQLNFPVEVWMQVLQLQVEVQRVQQVQPVLAGEGTKSRQSANGPPGARW